MNDASKTLVFVGVAAVIGLVAYVSRPSPAEPLADDHGELLFDEFAPADVAELQIVKYESKNLDVQTLLTEGKLKPTSLEVKKEGESWVLPSHDAYPVDAEGKVAAAASALLGLEIEGVATDNPADHEDYGVVRPNIDRFDPEAAGVGTLVQMKNAAGDPLVNIVIGNEVKKFGDVAGQRYVRRADQDRVYIVRVDPAELSTQFKDWIKEDLLKLTAEEIHSLTLNDYAIIRNLGRAAIVPSSVSVLSKKDEKWKADSIQEREADSPKMKERKIGKEEELDDSKISALTRAFAALKIVDVSRKPQALAEAQRQGKLLGNDEESVIALQDHGFFPNIDGGKIQIFSDQGEVIAGLDSGVQYVLRFGSTAGLGDEEEEASPDEAKADKEKADQAKGDQNKGDQKNNEKEGGQPKKKAGLNRYIHVSTQFNQDLIPKPAYEDEPKLEDYLPKPKAAEQPKGEDEKKPNDAEKDANKKDEVEKAGAPKNGSPKNAKKEGAKKDETKKDEAKKDSGANLPTTGSTARLTQSDAKEEQPQDADAKDETVKEDAAKEETAKEETAPEDKAAEDKLEDENKPATENGQPAEGEEPKPADAKADRKEKAKDKPKKKTPKELAKEKFEKDVARIKKDNEKKRIEYEEKLGKGRELVEHLNARFADWFYVISESEYEKIHLTANDLIKKKGEPEENADGALPPGHPPTGGFQFPGAGLRDFPGAPPE